ncbi:hypothetical protein [Streptomyces sp. WZ-12]|uniref:hypothetical protein n=1 Tax=Streptomyces sp. WZ-12 TaxID=3030210 RepID=UPI00238155A3|nr:hypothetical protein [Streptomyces sp. WZ-12]
MTKHSWTPRRLEPKPRRRREDPDADLNPLAVIQETLWTEETPVQSLRVKNTDKPLDEWTTHTLIAYWGQRISRATWAAHLVGHTNRAALGKTFREAQQAGHGPALLKATIDAFFDNPKYRNTDRPWAYYRSIINTLIKQCTQQPATQDHSTDTWTAADVQTDYSIDTWRAA